MDGAAGHRKDSSMADLDRVLVLAGGMSPEHEVSVRSGQRVAEALRRMGLEVQVADTDAGLLPRLLEDPPPVVFPVLHGAAGEDGSVREVLELAGAPYVGARPGACRVAYAKPTASALVAGQGVDVPRGLALPKQAFHDLGAGAVLERVIARLGLPLFVKPASGGSAFGAAGAADAAALSSALVGCFSYADTAVIEERVAGTEIAVGVVDLGEGPQALPAVEIVPDGGVYDYAARYTAGRTEFFCPARLEEGQARAAAEAAVTVHKALGLRDISRTDLIVDADGRPRFLEVNVAPGLTETSTLPLAAQAAGMDFAVLCRDLAHQAAQRGG